MFSAGGNDGGFSGGASSANAASQNFNFGK